MLGYFERGFLKAAQDNMVSEEAAPDTEPKDTAVTCISDCQYAQNPEKRCMLDSITMVLEEGGFKCGQYSPEIDPALEQEEMMAQEQQQPQPQKQAPMVQK